MIAVLSTILLFGLAFLVIELVQRRLKLPSEQTRKYAHVVGAGGAAALPLWLGRTEIITVAAVFVVVMSLSKYVQGFHSIHAVSRTTYGEMLMPLAVILTAIFAANIQTYVTALLILAVSDTAANVIGTCYGRHRILNLHTSYEGSVAFLVSAVLCGVAVLLATGNGTVHELLVVIVVAVTATGFEAISSMGSDNITIPIAIVMVHNLLL